MSFSMNKDHWIGVLAGILTTAAFLPQIIQVLKSRETKDISLIMYLLSVTGVSIWTYYGFLIKAPPIVFFNAINLVLILIILFAKLYWK
ncbi:MAG: SemiSWEET family sugar transporter [Leptospirales bacterium]